MSIVKLLEKTDGKKKIVNTISAFLSNGMTIFFLYLKPTFIAIQN